MSRRKPIIGLCGGIGAGKSRVAAEFERHGCLVVDSDRLNHEVLGRPEVLQALRTWWGDDVIKPDGTPDRARIASRVFSSADEKRRLEGLVYPLIAQLRADMIGEVEDNSAIIAIVIDSPLLLESNLDRECDTIVFVDTDTPRRHQRLQRSRGWSVEEIERRERWQLTPTEKRSRAQHVIDNNGLDERLGSQVIDILNEIVARHSSNE